MVKKLQSILITTKIAKNTQEAIRLKSTTNPLLLRLCGALFELIILVKRSNHGGMYDTELLKTRLK